MTPIQPSLRRICSDGAAGSGSGDVSWLVAAYSTRASSFMRHGAPQGNSLDQAGEVATSRQGAEAVERRAVRRASSTSSNQEHQSVGRGGGVAAAFARARQLLRSLSSRPKSRSRGSSAINSSSSPVAIRQGAQQQPSSRSGGRQANSLPRAQPPLLTGGPYSEPASPRSRPSTATSASVPGSPTHSRSSLVDVRRGPHSSACLPPGPGEPAPSRQLRPALSSRQLVATSSFGSSSSSGPSSSSLGSGSVLSVQSSGCLGSPQGGSVWGGAGEQQGDEALPATSQTLELLYRHAESRKEEIRKQHALPVA